jgi:ribosomal protein S18 acetylase RimI-like enzyme
VNAIEMKRTLTQEVPDIVAKLPLTISFITDPSGAEELGRARFWEVYEERVWRKLSLDRQQGMMATRTQEFARRLRAGNVAVVGVHKGELVGAFWLVLKGSEENQLIDSTFVLKPGEAYLLLARVDRSLRGNRIYSMLLAEGLKYLKARSFTKVSLIIEEDNYPSIIAAERLGFRPVRLIKFRRLFSSVRHDETILDASG